MAGRQWKLCINILHPGGSWLKAWGPSEVTYILGRFFLDKSYSAEPRDLTDGMMQTIQDEFLFKIAQKDWLSDDVKRVAKEKVYRVQRKIGYPTSPLATVPRGHTRFLCSARGQNHKLVAAQCARNRAADCVKRLRPARQARGPRNL